MQFQSSQDVAKYFENLSKTLPYPRLSPKPIRERFSSHAAFGKAMDEWESERSEHRVMLEDYRQSQNRLEQGFKRELLKYLEIENHPNADKLYSLAWEHGHSSGFVEVASYAEEFVGLMK